MSDERLRELERLAKDDPASHVRFRRELIRLGRTQEAGLEVGDVTVYKCHRQRLVEPSKTLRRVRIECADESKHKKLFRKDGSHYVFCPFENHAGSRTNLDSKAVGVLVEPADPPGEKLPVGEGEHGPCWRLMTEIERDAACYLAACSFTPCSAAKRIARTLSEQATREDEDSRVITENQVRVLWELVWSYRRQIPKESLVEHARQALAERGVFKT